MREEPRKALIRERYDELGGSLYDLRYGEEQRAKYREALTLVKIEPWQTVLDNGCGTGLFLEELGSFAVGLDISLGLLREARNRTSSKENVHLVNGDSETLPLRSGVLDILFSFTVLQNMPHPERMLAESSRVASDKAKHLITVHRKTMNLDELRALIEKTSLKVTRIIDTENTNDLIVLAE
jgi:ubiquinone/menaquinone biosynthesis C-methylase UbiE